MTVLGDHSSRQFIVIQLQNRRAVQRADRRLPLTGSSNPNREKTPDTMPSASLHTSVPNRSPMCPSRTMSYLCSILPPPLLCCEKYKAHPFSRATVKVFLHVTILTRVRILSYWKTAELCDILAVCKEGSQWNAGPIPPLSRPSRRWRQR